MKTRGIPLLTAAGRAFPLPAFLALGLCGRMMRFAALFLLPRIL